MSSVRAVPAVDDIALARRCAHGDVAAIRLLTAANNQRLFRAAWSILKDRGEAEDPAAVVDPISGAVHGYHGLHVIDASVFPAIPRVNTHLAAVLVAEVLVAGLLAG